MQKIFIGDVQGCGIELVELLDRAACQFGEEFEIWVVGDLINRGPYNLLCLDRVRGLAEAGRARYVLGNHEIALIKVWLGLREVRPNDTFAEVLESSAVEGWIDWLRKRPLMERGRIGSTSAAMVHASVHPDWSLDELETRARRVERRLSDPDIDRVRAFLDTTPTADPELADDRDVLGRLTSCRSVDARMKWSSALPVLEFDSWHRYWSARGHDYGVVYGHWAVQGLHVAPGLRGLDTACVHHGRGQDGFLTAWLPVPEYESRHDAGHGAVWRSAFDVPDDRFWKIPAQRRYYMVE